MNIAVLEDNPEDRARLETLLSGFDFNIDHYPSGEIFLETGISKSYHLIIMDIYMGFLDGIETAARLQKIQQEALIVYLTSSEEDIWRAVGSHNCFDYIRKSDLTSTRLHKLLTDITNNLSIQEEKVVFYSGKQQVSLKLKDIQYVVSQNKYTSIVFKNNQERSYRVTFSYLYNLLKENEPFLLCNRGVLLNMFFIQKINKEACKMLDGSMFPLRKKDKKVIMEKYNDFQFKCLDSQEVID